MFKSLTVMDHTSSGILEKWIDGNRVLIKKEECPYFGPRTGQHSHFTFDINSLETYFKNCSGLLCKWDCFEGSDHPEEMRYNTIVRLVIVAFALLVIVSVNEWLSALVVSALLVLILWLTTVSTLAQSVDTLKPRKCRYV